MANRAVFLDRDGVLNERPVHHAYVTSSDELVVLPSVPRALRLLKDLGFLLIVVTNQRGIARGIMSHKDLDAVNSGLAQKLAVAGVSLDAIYSCPHAEDEGCQCRKPRPGMLLRAAREWSLSLSDSYLVGDAPSDVEAGRAAGCTTVILTGNHGHSCEGEATYECSDLLEAALTISRVERQGRIVGEIKSG
jgi:histidinol-phosphate phosphatase family protein